MDDWLKHNGIDLDKIDTEALRDFLKTEGMFVFGSRENVIKMASRIFWGSDQLEKLSSLQKINE